jgi:hypothetical protein
MPTKVEPRGRARDRGYGNKWPCTTMLNAFTPRGNSNVLAVSRERRDWRSRARSYDQPYRKSSRPGINCSILTSVNSARVNILTVLLITCCAPSPAPHVPAESPPDGESSAESSSNTGQPAPTTSASAQVSSIAATSSDPATDGSSTASPNTPDQLVSPAQGTGPAIGGPRSNRPCAFHESVDSYQRLCTVNVNADGSLHVEAKGTRLNPDNGFEFTMHGGPHNFFAHGTLNSFGICAGPFTSQVGTVIDKGVTTYELRLSEHCKIVIR